MQVLTIPSSSIDTTWIADPTERFATVVVDALLPYVPAHVTRRFPSPLESRYDLRPPAWVLDDWHRATWATSRHMTERARTIVIAARVPPDDLVVDPMRTVGLVFDPHQVLDDDRAVDQWPAIDGDDGGAGVETLIAVDSADALVDLLAAALGIGPKRAQRALTVAARRWPRFQPRKGAPDRIDVELYARATGARSLDAT